jgi:peptide/nickel transport system permease protein
VQKGLRELVVLYRHALKNTLIPVVTIMGLQVGNLLAGAVVVETVFACQGIGRLLIEGMLARDFPLVQG